jgi:transposase
MVNFNHQSKPILNNKKTFVILCLPKPKKRTQMNEYDKLSKLLMWCKIKQLISDGLNYSQISRQLEMHRGTVALYASMTYEEFTRSKSYQRKYAHKLDAYEDFVLELLKKYPFVSAAQVHDRLREHYPDFIKVSDKTVFNFVRRLRLTHDIPKEDDENHRQTNKLPETDYGEYGQVDFGEKWMRRADGSNAKVYFFALVLSRSRYKFIYFSKTPFTSTTAIYAHELAFAYMGGRPKKLVYDQDRVFIKDENLGDYKLTARFRAFCASEKIDVIFCRKSDPQSKGKVENVVKYVKHNFLSAREFIDIDTLNKEAIAWLERTANGTVHHGIRAIPAEIFAVEKEWLVPYCGTPSLPEESMTTRIVRRDNTVMYEGNFYTVPSGTYQGDDTSVFIENKDGTINIFSKETGKTIATHPLCTEKGKTIRNQNHVRVYDVDIEDYKKDVLALLPRTDNASLWIEKAQANKKRYIRDTLKVIEKKSVQYTSDTMSLAIDKCIDLNVYNANTLMEVAEAIRIKKREAKVTPEICYESTNVKADSYTDKLEKSKMSTYEDIIQQAI